MESENPYEQLTIVRGALKKSQEYVATLEAEAASLNEQLEMWGNELHPRQQSRLVQIKSLETDKKWMLERLENIGEERVDARCNTLVKQREAARVAQHEAEAHSADMAKQRDSAIAEADRLKKEIADLKAIQRKAAAQEVPPVRMRSIAVDDYLL